MDLHETLVTEALFSEVANKGWSDFMKKYQKIDHPDRYFVNFSNFAGSTEDKRFVGQAMNKPDKSPSKAAPGEYFTNKSGDVEQMGPSINQAYFDKKARKRATPDQTLFTPPSHNDPIGIYTYPLKYVLDKTAGVPYGKNMKYMRVIKARPGINVLKLNEIDTKEKAIRILHKMGVFDEVSNENAVWSMAGGAIEASYIGNTKQVSKYFFYIFQHSYTKTKPGDPVWSGDKISEKGLSGVDQTARLRKVGYDAVVDEATDRDSATIHPNEPTQAFFVNRGAFDIEDVFEVTDVKISKHGLKKETFAYSVDSVSMRIASKLANMLGDRIMKKMWNVYGGVDHRDSENKNVRTDRSNVFVTKKGRMISVDSRFDTDEVPQGHVPITSYVELKGENGKVEATKMPKETIEKFTEDFMNKYKAQETDPKWSPTRGDASKETQAWRNAVNNLTFTLKHSSGFSLKTVKSYTMKTEVNLEELTKEAAVVCNHMSEALSNVGWHWTPPAKWYDKIGAWVVIEEFHQRMNKQPARPTLDHVSRAVDKIRSSSGTASRSIYRIQEEITDPEKQAAAITWEQATNMTLEPGHHPTWWDGLLTGLYHLYTKHTEKMVPNPYPNYDKPFSPLLPHVVDMTKHSEPKKTYPNSLFTSSQ